uniref:PB1 domain-containing protein n=1 Tax=Oryzias sinensis TaxID=183150 RepID=A0A8C8DGH7_9TELE
LFFSPSMLCNLGFDAEYRRFGLKRSGPGNFQEFYRFLQNIHHIRGMDVLLGYADIHGDLLPINNDENFYKAVSSANPLLRIVITKREHVNVRVGSSKIAQGVSKAFSASETVDSCIYICFCV